MSNRDMKVSVLVQLIDRLTAPLRGITQGIAATANRIGDLGRRIGLIGSALAALSFMAPIQQAAAWDAQLRDIAITAGKTGGAVETMIGDLSKRYQKLAFDTGQSSMDVAKGAQLLIASGMDSGLIDKLLPTIAKVATATNATLEDTAKTAFALSETLKVPADQMEAMLGKLVTAGKLGRFEFKNMAMEFPELTAQMAKFGIVGKEAVEFLGSSLQIAMLGTANPSEAATNLKNFLTKINAPEAIKKFEKELKVDVTGVMTDATAKGINPIEAVIQKMTEKLKPHQAEIDKIMKKAGVTDKQREEQIKTLLAGTKVGKLYSDMQVLGFILPMMQNIDKFKEFKRQLKEAGTDVIIDDFASRMRGLEPQMKQFGVLTGAIGNRIGLAFASNLPAAMKGIQELLKWVEAIDQKWPGVIDKTLSWAGALLVVGASIAILTPVISALAAVLGIILSPIGLIVVGLAALAVGATYVYQNWAQIGPQLQQIWTSVAEAVTSWPARAWTALVEFGAMVSRAGAQAGQQLVDALMRIDLSAVGAQLAKALIDGFSRGLEAIVSLAAGLPGRIIAAIGNIDLSSIIKMPSWLGGGAAGKPGGPAVDPMGNPTGFNPTSAPSGTIGGSNGFTRTTAANSNVQVGGQITVAAAEGSRIVNVQSQNPAVPMVPNRGTMLGRA